MPNKNELLEPELIETDPSDEEPVLVESEDKKQVKVEKKSGNKFIYLILLIMIVAFLAAAYYLWEAQKNQHLQLTQLTQEVAASSGLEIKISELESDLNSINASVTQNSQQIQVIVSDVGFATEKSQQAIDLVNRSQRDWALAEIDYLLRMAHRRLEVAKDVAGSIAALKGADSRLNELADLKLFKIRKQIAKDIANLSAIKQPDVTSVVLSIDQALAYLSDMPFKSVKSEIQAQLPEPEAEIKTTEPTFVESVIETVKQIGDIKVHQRSVEVVGGEKRQTQIEQLLYAHLLGARLAVLNYDQKNFMYELEQSNTLIEHYYDANDNRIKSLNETLNTFKSIQLVSELPELTAAWDMLQKEMIKPADDVAQEAK